MKQIFFFVGLGALLLWLIKRQKTADVAAANTINSLTSSGTARAPWWTNIFGPGFGYPQPTPTARPAGGDNSGSTIAIGGAFNALGKLLDKIKFGGGPSTGASKPAGATVPSQATGLNAADSVAYAGDETIPAEASAPSTVGSTVLQSNRWDTEAEALFYTGGGADIGSPQAYVPTNVQNDPEAELL